MKIVYSDTGRFAGQWMCDCLRGGPSGGREAAEKHNRDAHAGTAEISHVPSSGSPADIGRTA